MAEGEAKIRKIDWVQTLLSFILGAIAAFAATFFIMGQRVATVETQIKSLDEKIVQAGSGKTQTQIPVQDNSELLKSVEGLKASLNDLKAGLENLSKKVDQKPTPSLASSKVIDEKALSELKQKIERLETLIERQSATLDRELKNLSSLKKSLDKEKIVQGYVDKYLAEYGDVEEQDKEASNIDRRKKYLSALTLLEAIEALADKIDNREQYIIFAEEQRCKLGLMCSRPLS